MLMKLESEMNLIEIENAKDPTATITETIEFSLIENRGSLVCLEMRVNHVFFRLKYIKIIFKN
jgi:hypothetical protein